jgi:hypothetical protein
MIVLKPEQPYLRTYPQTNLWLFAPPEAKAIWLPCSGGKRTESALTRRENQSPPAILIPYKSVYE